jgi:hypothetical protein
MFRVAAPVLFGGLVAASSPSFSQFLSRVAPAPPTLEPFEGKWHTDTYALAGSIDSLSFGGWVRVLRNGSVVDSVTATLSTTFSFQVGLLPGLNQFTAVLVDSALVTSPPSNTVYVTFDTKAGFFYPIPFTPGGSFDLNAVRTASGANVRIFDMEGNLVVRFESDDARTFYSFPWDGNNGTGHGVRRGPLVAVATIDYPDGAHEVIRQVFLFHPEGSP